MDMAIVVSRGEGLRGRGTGCGRRGPSEGGKVRRIDVAERQSKQTLFTKKTVRVSKCCKGF